MSASTDDSPAPAEILAYYASASEETRLETAPFQLELQRTKAILLRFLPTPPARVLDIGGAAGTYSAWLAELGYEVHLLDASKRLIDVARQRDAGAREPLASIQVGDARRLPYDDASVDAVLLLGPLYHLTEAADRERALREALRTLRGPGVVVAAAISRYASALGGLALGLGADPAFAAIRDRDLVDGQHRNDTDRPEYFTTAYFHRPEDLRFELGRAGLERVRVLGVEAIGWLLPDFAARWADPTARDELLFVAGALEEQPSVLGASAHLLGIGWKGTAPPRPTER